jgi:3-oxoacyl-[acyl-carrier protein] reductase
VLSHCERVDSSVLTTTVESWDRHFAVNAHGAWLLIRAFAEQLPGEVTTQVTGRIIALTSDHSAHNLPYGASKGALDRIVIAAAVELADRGIRANVINPGPIDTGWMTPDIRHIALAQTPAGRIGTAADTPTSCDSSCPTPEAGSLARSSTATAGSEHPADVTTRRRQKRKFTPSVGNA